MEGCHLSAMFSDVLGCRLSPTSRSKVIEADSTHGGIFGTSTGFTGASTPASLQASVSTDLHPRTEERRLRTSASATRRGGSSSGRACALERKRAASVDCLADMGMMPASAIRVRQWSSACSRSQPAPLLAVPYPGLLHVLGVWLVARLQRHAPGSSARSHWRPLSAVVPAAPIPSGQASQVFDSNAGSLFEFLAVSAEV